MARWLPVLTTFGRGYPSVRAGRQCWWLSLDMYPKAALNEGILDNSILPLSQSSRTDWSRVGWLSKGSSRTLAGNGAGVSGDAIAHVGTVAHHLANLSRFKAR
jgi:hypothetical protein